MLLTYITPNTRINTGLRGGGMTSHKGWSEYINKDKYVQPSLTSLRQIHDFIKRGQKLLDPTYVKDFNKSVLIIHGSSDRVNEPKGSIDFFNLINVSDKELHIIEGSRHKVLAEKEEIYLRAEKIILSWLNKRSKAKL
ncbi:hypothetical protein WICMUC_002349 [Wickerhamomyces mucosus]|uniref:Serine aminopeptidase S33 domain-containing protein n=1 Tax=Wickerhamomyces mucosus TaxID=1378264 RepID=A0A9P8PPU6_9ASCO|nr:hypothetical protein WICMUC_002349 [Wickerhamomyces mucosus]